MSCVKERNDEVFIAKRLVIKTNPFALEYFVLGNTPFFFVPQKITFSRMLLLLASHARRVKHNTFKITEFSFLVKVAVYKRLFFAGHKNGVFPKTKYSKAKRFVFMTSLFAIENSYSLYSSFTLAP